jgi:hypothetical protein
LIPLQGDSVGVRLDTAAGTLGCMAEVLDKCTIIEVGTGELVSNTTDSVGVRFDTAAGTAELVIIPILVCMADVLD